MDTLTFRGRTYRVECNFNALCAFSDYKGCKDFSCLSGELSYQDLLRLLVFCVNEGERLEGRPHDHASEDFGVGGLQETRDLITAFTAILNRQTSAGEDGDAPGQP